jgi:bacillolysin
VRQSDAHGVISVFGSYYEGIGALPVQPALSAEQAEARVTALAGHPAQGPAQLYVFPRRDAEGYALVWRLRASDGLDRYAYFVDASSGALVYRLADRPTQTGRSAVGLGHGVLDDTKKMSVEPMSSGFVATDRLRPGLIRTFDLRGNSVRAANYFFRLSGRITESDLAQDTDNDWRDGAVVDAHTYSGYTYDYYFKRLGRRGLDNNDFPMFPMVHLARREDLLSQPPEVIGLFYLNAFYDGNGVAVFGEGLPPEFRVGGQQVNYFAGALDIVAHELTHGVTEFSSNLAYVSESGALNEAFSDMMGTAVEFFFQEPGSGPLRADYLLGEDVITPGGTRSMANPMAHGDPDHYSVRLVASSCGPQNDNCFVHSNSGIPNHAFYLAIEGGTNRVSGLTVQGVGAANREQVEKAFYRAFTSMLGSQATFSQARAATVQSARDLYGAGSAAERAVIQAWTAVGVP